MESKRIELKDGPVLVLRDARKADAAELLEFIDKISGETDYLTFGPGEFNTSLEQEEEFVKSHVESENHYFTVAEIDGAIAGTVVFIGGGKPRIRHAGEIGLSVLKKYWGYGVGSALVESLIEWAKSSGIIRKLNLRVRPDNERAVRLYEKFGFVREGVISRDYFFDGQFYDSIFMGLELD